MTTLEAEKSWEESNEKMRKAVEDHISVLKDVIRSLQWGSCDGCGQKEYCPICDAPAHDFDYNEGKHKPDCPVGKVLNG